MHELIGDVLVEVVGLALHGVLDAVLDGQQSEQEQQAIIETFLTALLLVFGELDGREDPLVYVAPVGTRTHLQGYCLLDLGEVDAFTGILGLRY